MRSIQKSHSDATDIKAYGIISFYLKGVLSIFLFGLMSRKIRFIADGFFFQQNHYYIHEQMNCF